MILRSPQLSTTRLIARRLPSSSTVSIMPLDSVPIDLDDAAHARLDTLVFDQSPGPDCSPMVVLALVVTYSDGKLDQQYGKMSNSRKLLETYPELRDKIKEAYDMRSFKDIRNLSKFISTKS